MLTFDVQVSFNLLKHEMQLSGAISIWLMVEWTDSYGICALACSIQVLTYNLVII